ncbi:ferredoxin [Saccharopolyspora sp. ID03-671]|uniref:ferredoxin n=1 Tax=Saccharopolyspora sp. ID03-671 TaxID=3073066 RepID=UPI00324FC27E
MRINIDFDRCEGHGMCALVAPSVFEIDENGNTQFVAEPPDSEQENVLEAVRACPAAAIKILDDGGARQ